MASLAARDQENLFHSNQTTAASKPLNQGRKGLQPKTPGNRPLQTPFQGRTRDENAAVNKYGDAGAHNNQFINPDLKGKQTILTTPAPAHLVPRNALAPKTTNAKAKTPGLIRGPKDVSNFLPRSGHRPPSLRKSKIIIKETSQLDIPIDVKKETPPSSPEIEYMPPKAVDLPDIDDDLAPLDFSELKGRSNREIVGDFYNGVLHIPKGLDGVSKVEREVQQEAEIGRLRQLREDAETIRNLESVPLSCTCEPECPTDKCKNWAEQARLAEEKYQKSIASLQMPWERHISKTSRSDAIAQKQKLLTKPGKPSSRTGFSEAASRQAANALSMKSEPEKHTRAVSRNYPRPWLTGSKVMPSIEHNIGHENRYVAAVAASKTNLGFTKGRAVKQSLNSSVPQQSAPSKNTELEMLQDMWRELRQREDEEDGTTDYMNTLKDNLHKEAEEDFILQL